MAAARGASLRTLPTQVETTGAASGHCAFLSIIRASGAALGAAQELVTVQVLRKIAVLGACARMISDPRCAYLQSQPTTQLPPVAPAASVARWKRVMTRRMWCDISSRSWTCGPPRVRNTQVRGYTAHSIPPPTLFHAGPLELDVVADALGITVAVFVEEGSRDCGTYVVEHPRTLAS